MDDLYARWNDVCLTATGQWKRHPDVVFMLEHVKKEFAETYLDICVAGGIPLDVIQVYARRVDAVGGAQIEVFRREKILVASSTCLRYLCHAMEIVNFLQEDEIVEIGGGYGGLLVAIAAVREFFHIETPLRYTILDLPGPNCLQKKYVSCFPLGDIDVHIRDGREEYEFERVCLVSNYCLAEMGQTNREKYIETVVPKAARGYFQWNSRASLDFLSSYTTEIVEEHPKTGPHNKTVKFTRALN